jgi:hypothetical protein
MEPPRERLYGRWLHSHEEDTDDEMVFRSASAKLPPSRGREGLELNEDGSYAETRPGPDDRPRTSSGRWRVEDDDRLVVETQGGESRRAMQIVAADGETIVVRKPAASSE